MCLNLSIREKVRWEGFVGPDPIPTDYGIAHFFAIMIPTLKYFEVSRSNSGKIVGTTWWRIYAEKTERVDTGQEVSRDNCVQVKEIAEEDGVNARNYFDWEWQVCL
jgi:hypothetical protein